MTSRFVAGLSVLTVLSFAPLPSVAAAGSVGVIGGRNGEVSLVRGGKRYAPRTGNRVYAEDELVTGSEGKARILFLDDSVLTIGPRSRVRLGKYAADDSGRAFSLEVLGGRFRMAVAKWLLGPTDGKVSTPTAVAGVRGTMLWGDTELDAVCALEGEITLQPLKGDVEAQPLTAGECRAGMANAEMKPISPSPEDLKGYLEQVTLDPDS